jgi:hypothetical protein
VTAWDTDVGTGFHEEERLGVDVPVDDVGVESW